MSATQIPMQEFLAAARRETLIQKVHEERERLLELRCYEPLTRGGLSVYEHVLLNDVRTGVAR